MSFDKYLKKKDWKEQLRILIDRNEWRKMATVTPCSWKAINTYRKQHSADGIRFAELLNLHRENI